MSYKKFTLLLVPMLAFAGTIDWNQLFPYDSQFIPSYIQKDNLPQGQTINNATATLGRVLFYDRSLSVNNAVSCASCHKQEFAFGDTATLSVGFNGDLTHRHSMRLANARFSSEVKFFWDERATSLENQTTQPLQDFFEMGFSGMNGQPDIDSLTRKLSSISYYPALFNACFGDPAITENRIRTALSMFIRSIQSFDSKYDAGLAMVGGNINANFPNFTQQENTGKTLFTLAPPNGAGCQGCHRAPEFDIDPNSENNNRVGVAGSPGSLDLNNTRSPSLRDLVNPSGIANGPFMHDGSLSTLMQVIEHYNAIVPVPGNNRLDNRLRGPNGTGQQLNLSQAQKNAIQAFLLTLTGTAIYTDEQWSDPFDSNGNLTIHGLTLGTAPEFSERTLAYPNPAREYTRVRLPSGVFRLTLYDMRGNPIQSLKASHYASFSWENTPAGEYILKVENLENNSVSTHKLTVLSR